MIDPSSLSSFGATAALASLGDLAVKATIVLSVTILLDFLLGRKRPLARCGLWYATLAALAVLPLASLLLPPLTITRPMPPPAVAHSDSHFIPHAGRNEAFSRVQGGGPSQAVTLSGDGPGGPSSGSAEAHLDRHFRAVEGAPGVQMDWASLVSLSVVAVYLLGGVVLTIRLLMSLRAVAALSSRATPLAAAQWNEPLADWRRRLAVARPVKLLVSPELTVPVQIGWLSPAILLPPRVAASQDDGTRAAVLVHELGHVRRGDYLWNLVLRLVAIVYWPHPLTWFAARRIGQLREQACDDLCVHWLGGAAIYRSRLIELAAGLLQKPVASLGMAMSKTARLSRRLAALDASPGRPHCVPSALARRSAVAAMLLVAAALGAATFNRSTAAAQELKTKAADAPPNNDAAPKPVAGDKENEQPPAAKPGDTPETTPPATGQVPIAPAADQPVRVRVGRVTRHDFTIETSQACQLEAARTMAVYARVPGEVQRLLVEIGDHVVKGQPLAELDSPQLAPQAAQAEAQAAAAAAEVEQSRAAVREAEARLTSSDADRQGAEAEVEAAEVKLTYATKRHTRIRQLAKQNAVNDEGVDEAEEDLSAAKAGAKIAKSHSESVKALIGPREAVVAAAHAAAKLAAARLRVAEAELARVKLQGGETTIVSPLEGVVIEMNAHAGDFVGRAGKNDRICAVADLRQMRATAYIPEKDALKIKRGGSARVFLDAFPGKSFPAKVSLVGFNIESTTRTMKVELSLASEDAEVRLLPGMTGAAAVALEVHRDTLSMPTKQHLGTTNVLKVVDGRAEEVRVKFGGRSYDRLEVLSGLQEGDVVVIGLAEGQNGIAWDKHPQVEIIEAEEK